MTPMTDAQAAKATTAEVAVFEALFKIFGAAWADDPSPPSNTPAEVARLRAQLAVPMAGGALAGVMAFVWITAPPGGTLKQLRDHILRNVEAILTERNFPDLGGAGSFWTGDEMVKAMAGVEGE